tara:strand:- start:457 stop:2538 length:2082 start_codon:yes stop_codon:yes gene_type:complete
MLRSYFIILIVIVIAQGCRNDNNITKPFNNPLIVAFNQINDFNSLEVHHIEDATNFAINYGDQVINQVINIPDNKKTYENTLKAQDDAWATIDRIQYPIYLLGEVHPDSAIRASCDTAVIKFSKWSNDVSLNEDLYNAVKIYSLSENAKFLKGIHKKYLEDTMKGYRRLGFELSKEKRDTLKSIKNRLTKIGLEFSKNITEHKDTLVVSEEEMKGTPDWYKKAMYDQKLGNYKIDISRPSRTPFMRYSESKKARRELSEKFLNRGIKNLDVIPKMLNERHKMANTLGYRSYAEYLLEDRMPKKPERVWEFEADLHKNLKAKAKLEHEELKKIKKRVWGVDDDQINYWNMFYLENIRDIEKYQLNDEQIKEYFELNNVRDGMFKITQSMLGLRYEQIENPSVWHPDVTMYKVFDDETNKKLGYFYLDLFPRENKYSHAAHFSISKGWSTESGYQYPIAALVCNFPKPSNDRPSLLQHGPNGEVETFFHEFGHLLHGMVTNVPIYSYSGTSVDRDFVEAPSQIFENWIWEEESVKLFAKHYKTNETIPDELLSRMLLAKNRSSGNDFSFQVFLGSLDMTLYDRWDPNSNPDIVKIARKLHKDILTWYETPNTARIANFGHLNGYAASYYGYAWSRVMAQDMYSVFKKEGILNPEVGKRFRKQILAPGGSKEPMDLVKTFLGREPDSRALAESLGL